MRVMANPSKIKLLTDNYGRFLIYCFIFKNITPLPLGSLIFKINNHLLSLATSKPIRTLSYPLNIHLPRFLHKI